MRSKRRIPSVRGVAFVNRQKQHVVRTASLLAFTRSLKRRLRLESREFNICFVDDNAMRNLNLAYRGKDQATDVLSFPWNSAARPPAKPARSRRGKYGGFTNFLGDIVISVEAARRNATTEGHATLNEIRWLILHGLLHLLGYDHAIDTGEMNALELALREQLKVAGGPGATEKKNVKAEGDAAAPLNL